MTLVAGVDAGATQSRAVILDDRGAMLGAARGAAGAVRPGRLEAAANAIAGTFHEAVRTAARGQPDALVVGAAGAGARDIQEALAAELRSRGAPARTLVTTDAEVAFADAFPTGPGVLMLAGTGSIALARDLDGAMHRAGGLGWLVGDEGSGFAMGRDGIAAAGRALDGRGPATALDAVLPAAAGLDSVSALLAWARTAGVDSIAALGAALQAAARDGDPVASTIVEHATGEILAHLHALARHFPADAGIPIVLGGGALATGGPLRLAVIEALASERRFVVRSVDLEPARGAATLATHLLAKGPGA